MKEERVKNIRNRSSRHPIHHSNAGWRACTLYTDINLRIRNRKRDKPQNWEQIIFLAKGPVIPMHEGRRPGTRHGGPRNINGRAGIGLFLPFPSDVYDL